VALFDFLKRKKEVQKAKEKSPDKTQKTQKKSSEGLVKNEIKEVVKEAKEKKSKKDYKFSYAVIREPHISEKATYLGNSDKYTFKVYDNANKLEIKKSIEGIYRVDVLAVNIIKIPAKKRRIGKTQGFKKGHTKAIVTIKEGQKIEVF